MGQLMGTVVRAPQDEPAPRELTPAEARAIFDRRTRAELGISGHELIRAWDAGEVDPDDDRVIGLWMILPFGR